MKIFQFLKGEQGNGEQAKGDTAVRQPDPVKVRRTPEKRVASDDEEMNEQLFEACKSYVDIEALKKLLESGISPDSFWENTSCLCLVAEKSNLKKAKLLLEHGANVELATKWGATPLGCAVMGDSLDMVNLMLEYGADPLRESGERPPLVYALKNLDVAIAERLMSLGAELSDEIALDALAPIGFLEEWVKESHSEDQARKTFDENIAPRYRKVCEFLSGKGFNLAGVYDGKPLDEYIVERLGKSVCHGPNWQETVKLLLETLDDIRNPEKKVTAQKKLEEAIQKLGQFDTEALYSVLLNDDSGDVRKAALDRYLELTSKGPAYTIEKRGFDIARACLDLKADENNARTSKQSEVTRYSLRELIQKLVFSYSNKISDSSGYQVVAEENPTNTVTITTYIRRVSCDSYIQERIMKYLT